MRGSSVMRALMWAKMRRFAAQGRSFALADLGAGRAPRHYLNLLIHQGYVRVVDPGVPQVGRCARYELVRNTGPAAPVQYRRGLYDPNCAGEIRDPLLRVWAALRRLGWVRLRELAMLAQTDAQTARKYVRWLERFGYVEGVRLRRGDKGVRLLRDTGPAAPVPEKKTGRLFDPNLACFVEVDADATA